MDNEQQALYNQLEEYFRNFKPKNFLKLDDTSYGLQGAEDHFEEFISWIKRFFRNKVYISQLPQQQLINIVNNLNSTYTTIKNIDELRENDPTQFKTNKKAHIQELENRYNEVYQSLIIPLRSYLANERGGLAEISKTAEQSLETVKQSAEAIEQVEDARREATADEASSQNAQHFEALAKTYENSKRNWIIAFWGYILVWVIGMLIVYTISGTVRTALKDFDVSDIPAYVLKVALVAIFGFGLNFISRNYNARLVLMISAETRATRLKTWRAFVSSPELNTSEPEIVKVKADVVLEIAKVIFSDIPTGLDRGKSRVFEAPINITKSN